MFFITSAGDKNIVNVDDYSGNSLENLLHSLMEHGWGGGNSERELVVSIKSFVHVHSHILPGLWFKENLLVHMGEI